jgi:leader peptidase (prepilin peptidase)/N-methyltransferase
VASVLLALTLIDWDTLLLPDALTLPLLWAGLVAAALGWTAPGPQALADALWGAVLGYGSLRTVGGLSTLVTGKEGLRHGDFKLMAALGAWLGPYGRAHAVAGLGIARGCRPGHETRRSSAG